MVFNSYIFIFLFLPIAVVGYYAINKYEKYQLSKIWLIAISLWFYALFGWQCLALLAVSVLINYFCASAMRKMQTSNKNDTSIFAISLILNIGLLFWFKYYNFSVENINSIFNSNLAHKDLIVPVGISFFTFQQLAFLTDVHKKQSDAISFLDYATYMTFFPKIAQGPITLPDQFIPMLNEKDNKRVNYDNLLKGMVAFSIGLAKKVLLADNLVSVVNAGFNNYANRNSVEILVAMLAYSFQIYLDFSGYCDMAYGIGLMFNLELPINFDSPYKADSIADFWQRWHITLNQFFTKYVYIPMGGSRKGKIRTVINVLVVFLISGIWHGANWTFVLWGLLNGLFVVIYRLGKKWIDVIPKFIKIPVTFLITTLLWSIFRSPSVHDSMEMIKRLFTAGFGNVSWEFYDTLNKLTEVRFLCVLGLQRVVDVLPWIVLFVLLLAIMVSVWFAKNVKQILDSYKPKLINCFVFVTLMLLSVLSLSQVTEFIYFNF